MGPSGRPALRFRLKYARVLTAALLAAAAAAGCGSGAPADPVRGGAPMVDSLTARRAVIWAVGDGADGGAAGRAVAARIAAGRVDRLLYLGDVYPSGTRTDFARNYATTYGPLASKTAPTPGNHDWPNSAGGYDVYWRRALHRTASDWYAFRAAGWQLLSLNSEAPHARGSAQERWLRARLRAPGTCRIAFWHRPRYSAGAVHGDQQDMAALWNDLRGHAVIVLGGHDHDMQRFKPIDGMTQFVSGAGGRSHYRVRSDDSRLAFGNDRDYGALRMILRPGVARYAFIAADGRVLDRGTIGCRRS
jgi:calcineurin-like phosphoesterase family protein